MNQEHMKMNPLEDFEARNARAWDEDTVVSEAASDRNQISTDTAATPNTANTRSSTATSFQHGIPRSGSFPNVAAPRGSPLTPASHGRFQQPGQQSPSNRGSRRTRQSGGGHQSISSSASTEIITSHGRSQANAPLGRGGSFHTKNNRSTPRASPSQGRFQSNRQRSDYTASARSKWASAEGLVTTRRAKDRDDRTTKAAELESFLRAPNDNESYPVIGFYMWPSKHEPPSELLGARLERLDPVRLQYRVHIEDMPGEQCLKISVPASHFQPENWLTQAIAGIRAAVKDTKAKAVAARPLYIVAPPSASAMRSIVHPAKVDVVFVSRPGSSEEKKVWRASELEFAGDNLSDTELLAWKNSECKALAESNLRRFEDHLIKSLMELAPDKGLMEMRLHFGRATFTLSKPQFKAGNMDFKGFVAMTKIRGMETEFDNTIEDAVIAMRLRDMIISSPEQFRPVQASLCALEDTEFKETAVIVVKKQDGEQFRIEVDLDKNLENIASQYQAGTIKHFRNTKKNLRMQIETFNIERQIDYSLKVVSDNTIQEVSKNLFDVTRDLVPMRSILRQDTLGLIYPNITPKFVEGLEIVSVAVRSTVQYMLKKSTYIVEIAIDRQWPSMNTGPTPKIVASVSMKHNEWEWEMRSLQHSPNERKWSPDLSGFFDNSSDGSSRIAKFVSEVEIVQRFLAAATHPEAFQAPLDMEQPDLYSADD